MSGKTFEETLGECLEALDSNATIEHCLSTYPGERESLRPYLELRSRLRPPELPLPSPAAYQRGRELLLSRVVANDQPSRAGPHSTQGWLSSRLGRAAIVAASLLLLLAGGAFTASAAGVDQAHDVLAALRIPAPSRDHPRPPSSDDTDVGTPDESDTGAAPVATEEARPDDSGGPGSSDEDNDPERTPGPGAGLGAVHRKCKDQDQLDRVPVLRFLFVACPTPAGEHPAQTPGPENTDAETDDDGHADPSDDAPPRRTDVAPTPSGPGRSDQHPTPRGNGDGNDNTHGHNDGAGPTQVHTDGEPVTPSDADHGASHRNDNATGGSQGGEPNERDQRPPDHPGR